jgi:putative alpha-1,2-mannosidase
LDAKITRISDTEIEGYSLQNSGGFNDYIVLFVARFNKPFDSFGGWEGNNIQQNISEIKGKEDINAYVDFDTDGREQFLLQTTRLNNKTLNTCRIKFRDIVNGGTLELVME